jgi:hypothetical protein
VRDALGGRLVGVSFPRTSLVGVANEWQDQLEQCRVFRNGR